MPKKRARKIPPGFPLLLAGNARASLPTLLRGRVFGDFRRAESYFATLFDLILTLYRIDFSHPAVSDLRDALRGETVGGRAR